MASNLRIFAAETVGTAVLVLVGPGSAIIASDKIGTYGVALAFGLALLIMAYAIGPISGCHINPAVTVGMWLARKIETVTIPFYVVGQLLGAAVAALILFITAHGNDTTGTWAANGWGDKIGSNYGLGPTVIVEIVFTALLVAVILLVTSKGATPALAGLAIGLTLTAIHLTTIPVDNTAVNPARSFASALMQGTSAWSQLWAFIVFPLIGAIVGVFVWLLIGEGRLEDTRAAHKRLIEARDRAAGMANRAASQVEDRTN
jgi:aquaporin Z